MRNGVSAGIIAGGIVGAVALSYAVSDGRAKRRMEAGRRRMARRASEMFDLM